MLYWWNEKIEKEVGNKRKKYLQYVSSKNIQHRIIYKETQARVRRMIDQKKNESWEKNCRKINTYLGKRKNTES